MELIKIMKALGEPMRMRIYQAILERKHCVRSLSKKLGVSEPAISQHIKVMREAGLVYGEQYGYHTHYLPQEEALHFVLEAFSTMEEKSQALDRDAKTCNCEYRGLE